MTAFCDGNYYYRRHHHHDYYFYFYYYYLFVIDNSRNERKDRERRQKTQKRQKEDKTNHNGCRRRRGGGNTMEIQWCDGVVIVVVMVTHSKREKQQWTTILVSFLSLFVLDQNWIELNTNWLAKKQKAKNRSSENVQFGEMTLKSSHQKCDSKRPAKSLCFCQTNKKAAQVSTFGRLMLLIGFFFFLFFVLLFENWPLKQKLKRRRPSQTYRWGRQK